MKFLATHENSQRGSSEFPLELYHIDSTHPRYQMPFHWHIECEIIRVLEGSISLTLNDSTFMLKKGQAVFIPSGVIHGGTPYDCVYQCVVFSFEKFMTINQLRKQQYERDLGQGDYLPPILKDNTLINIIFTATKNKCYGYEFVVQGAILQLVGELISNKQADKYQPYSSAESKRINNIKEVLRLIREDYTKPLTLEMLANKAGLNLQYFCKAFKSITGKTPIDYLNYYRVECAAELLQADIMSVTEVAFSCGFNDLSYFTKLFKRHKGVSPREFKKQRV